MRYLSSGPRSRVLLASVGSVGAVAALVIPTMLSGGHTPRSGPQTPGAVAPATGGIDAPAPKEWLRLRAEARHQDHRNGQAAAPRIEASLLPTVGTVIPARVLQAYVHAAQETDRQLPSCNLGWNLLAGIGFIESDHAAKGGSAAPGWNGTSNPPIYGPMLDGTGKWKAVRDTDGGRLDGNKIWDRAVGPMQFMPSTWAMWGADGNGDGKADPQQIDDATLAAAHYLCAAADQLNQPKSLHRAVFAYNHDWRYVRAVLTVAANYAGIDPRAYGVVPAVKHKHTKPKSKAHRHRRHTNRVSNNANHTPATPRESGSPTPSASGSPRPSASGSPTSSATPSSTPSASPTDSPSYSPSNAPSATPSGTPSANATVP